MLFSLSFVILNLFLVHGRPADDAVTGATGRTQEDQQIDEACAPRMALGVDHYAACVAEKGREAEQERKRAAEAKRLMEVNEIPTTPAATAQVCNPSAAFHACLSASQDAARANNPSSTDHQINASLQACRAACNADSAQVLRNFLGDCRNQDSRQTKQAMLQTMNNCGSGTAAADPTGPSKETALDIITSDNMSLSDKFSALSLRAGISFSPAGNSTNSFASTSGTDLGDGIRYQQTTSRDGSVVYQYCKGSSCYSSYDVASSAPAPPAVFPVVFTQSGAGAAVPLDPMGEGTGLYNGFQTPTTNAEFAESAVDATTGLDASPRPPRRPANLGEPVPSEVAAGAPPVPTTDRDAQDTTAQTTPTDTSDDQQVVTPVQPNEPVNYQAGNFAGLQNAMSSPAGGGMASSSSAGGGEVSNGGSSSGGSFSGSSASPVSRPLAFAGSGQVSPSALRGADAPAASVAAGSRPAMDVAAPGGGSRGGGLADLGGGRMMASSRPTGPASLESSMTTAMRSDSFYRTSGGRGTGAAARTSARRTAPCKGPNCPRKARAGIAAANCDGNPQCLLALTGKLQGPRRQAAEEVWETDSSGVRRIRASAGERGIASVQRNTEPGGVVRGKIQDVLNHLGSSEVFKVDHDGMLEVDL